MLSLFPSFTHPHPYLPSLGKVFLFPAFQTASTEFRQSVRSCFIDTSFPVVESCSAPQSCGTTKVLTPAPFTRRQVSPLISRKLPNIPSPTTLMTQMSLCTPLFPAHLVLFRLHLALAGSPSFAAESSSLYYGLPVRFRLLSTPHHCDAVSFSFGDLAFSDTDFHRAVCTPSRAHRGWRSQSLSNVRLGSFQYIVARPSTTAYNVYVKMKGYTLCVPIL